MTVHFACQAVTCWAVGRALGTFSVKAMMLTGMLVCFVRCGALALLAWRAQDKYALLATQTLDGVGAGIFDTLIRVAVMRLTQGTGRFGVTFGFVITCWQVGHGFSILLSEFIVQYAGYTAAFLTLAAICAANACLFGVGVRIPPAAAEVAK